ncbi:FAD-dependent oxidoreductase [Polymorphobacter sp. PAMC 29334]|nr:FAD-dependent oxidoreductase [Polymorphobacter sp. PAMC 29334]
MIDSERYDAVILGAGTAGVLLAWHLGAAGQRVAVVEQRYVGGSCPNIACLPSKSFIHSAEVAHVVATGHGFGVNTTGAAVSMPVVQSRKGAMVRGLIGIYLDNFDRTGSELVMGRGTFVDERTLEVALNDGGTRTLRGDRMFLDLGSTAIMPKLAGLAESKPMTHVELLDLDVVPEHLLIYGGGYIALEFAQAMCRLGSRVTVIERGERILHREDDDIAHAVLDLLLEEGVEVVTSAHIDRVTGRSGEGVTLYGDVAGVERAIEGSHLLVAVGKFPDTGGIGLERAGVALTASGHVQVNARLETTAEAVWAMGDCAGSPAFTHMSHDDFRIVRDNLAGGDRSTVGRHVPNCLFLDPELASVGLNEREAHRRGIGYRLAELPYSEIWRSHSTGRMRGKMKVLVGTDDRILGFTAFGAQAGELLPTVQIAMNAGLPYQMVAGLITAHPTYAEGLSELFMRVPPHDPT